MRTYIALALVATLLYSGIPLASAQSYQGDLTLNSIPSEVETGETIIFSGQLTASNGEYVVPGRTIFIKDDVAGALDIFIGSVVTDDNGEYSGSWEVEPRQNGGSYHMYAVFEGDFTVGHARSETYTLMIEGSEEEDDQTTTTYPTFLDIHMTEIVLDPLPSSAHAGESITFTGSLTSNGKPVSDAVVSIFKTVTLNYRNLGSDTTDSKGKFSITWQAEEDLLSPKISFNAAFNGDSKYSYSHSRDQVISVSKMSGTITLDPLPTSAKIGDVLTFTGKLKFNEGSSEGAVVFIKDEDPLDFDDLLATAYVNRDGTFYANWIVTEPDMKPDLVAEIYAIFEGNDVYQKIKTCEIHCQDSIKLQTYHGQEPTTRPSTSGASNEYMALLYSLDFSKKPLVTIVPSPDSYDETYGYIGATQEGILMWASLMDQRYGGNWDVEFHVVEKGDTFFDSKPDIIVNLVTPEEESGCADFAGVAYILESPVKPVQTKVCVVAGGQVRSNAEVSATTAHEFIHAMGLGHTWNVQGDLMCSIEMVGNTMQETCPYMWMGKSKTPSDLNIAAVAKLYGEDGFMNPNNSVDFESKFWLGQTNDESIANNDESYSAESTNEYEPDFPDFPESSDSAEPTITEPTITEPTITEPTSPPAPQHIGPVHIQSSMTNGFVDSYLIDTASTSLILQIETSTADGRLSVSLPRFMIDSKSSSGDDEEFLVSVDGAPASFSESRSNSEERTLSIPIPEGSSAVEIKGTEISQVQVVPEFPFALLIIAVGIGGTIVVGRYVAKYRRCLG